MYIEYPPVRPGGIPGGYDDGPGFGPPGVGRPPLGGIGPGGPGGIGSGTRCDEGDSYKQIGTRQRVRRQFVRRFTTVPSLMSCQRECGDARDFICRSFNYR